MHCLSFICLPLLFVNLYYSSFLIFILMFSVLFVWLCVPFFVEFLFRLFIDTFVLSLCIVFSLQISFFPFTHFFIGFAHSLTNSLQIISIPFSFLNCIHSTHSFILFIDWFQCHMCEENIHWLILVPRGWGEYSLIDCSVICVKRIFIDWFQCHVCEENIHWLISVSCV